LLIVATIIVIVIAVAAIHYDFNSRPNHINNPNTIYNVVGYVYFWPQTPSSSGVPASNITLTFKNSTDSRWLIRTNKQGLFQANFTPGSYVVNYTLKGTLVANFSNTIQVKPNTITDLNFTITEGCPTC